MSAHTCFQMHNMPVSQGAIQLANNSIVQSVEKENTAQALLRLCLLTVQVDSIRLELPQSALPASKDISAQLKTVVPIPNAFMATIQKPMLQHVLNVQQDFHVQELILVSPFHARMGLTLLEVRLLVHHAHLATLAHL